VVQCCEKKVSDRWLQDQHWKEKDGSLKLYDFVVANVPFSTKAWSNGSPP